MHAHKTTQQQFIFLDCWVLDVEVYLDSLGYVATSATASALLKWPL